MLVEQLIRETLELQGFRIESVVKAGSEMSFFVKRFPSSASAIGLCLAHLGWKRILDLKTGQFSTIFEPNAIRPRLVICTAVVTPPGPACATRRTEVVSDRSIQPQRPDHESAARRRCRVLPASRPVAMA